MRRHAKATLAVTAMLFILALAPPTLADTAPTPAIDPPANVTFNSVELSGTVNPNGGPSSASWYFQYRLKDEEGENWNYANFEFFSEEDSAKSEALPVSTFVNWLEPGKQYLFRLGASNEGGEQFSAVEEIETEAVNPPEASDLQISDVTDSGARFAGTVNSNGTEAGEATAYRFECSPQCPGLPGDEPIASDGTDQQVEVLAKDLEPNTEYTVYLVATNAAGQQDTEEAKFTTGALAPLAVTAYAAPRTTTTARLNGWVTPRNSPTTYFFEYGPEDCSANPCTAVPLSEDADGGSDNTHHLVSEEISGLSEGTTYHYRLIAENASGTALGEDLSFETRTTAEMTLPSRGYELVNTPDKGNQNVNTLASQRSVDLDPTGNQALWRVQAGAPGTNVGSMATMKATRTESGWVSRSFIPVAKDQIGNGSLQYFPLELNPESDRALFLVNEGLFSAKGGPLVSADVSGDQQVLGNFPKMAVSDAYRVEQTPDLNHVLFFDTDEGTIKDYGVSPPELVSVLPEGSPDCGARDFYDWEPQGGSPGYHWASMENASRVYFVASDCSGEALYVRDRVTEETSKVADDANLIRASWDGTEALFAAEGALTLDDENASVDIYRYKDDVVTECVTCLVKEANVQETLDGSATDDTILASENLSRVYFLSSRELIEGVGASGTARYVVSSERIKYVSKQTQIDEQDTGFTVTASDARVVLFTSTHDPTKDGTGGTRQLYRYDDTDGSLECVSCSRGFSTDITLKATADGSPNFRSSLEGGTVAISTRTKLLPEDVNGTADVYQWRNGRYGLITDGITEFPSLYGEPLVRGIDADGRSILFSVAAPLTGFEHDAVANLYVARVGGGFEQSPPPVRCSEESCQGPLAPAPATQAPGSATTSGPGNVAQKPQRKAKGKQRKRRTRKRVKRGKAAEWTKAKNGKRG